MTMMSASQTSLSCPAKAGHPVIAKLEIDPALRRILGHPPSRMMTMQEATS
jgi:hypothetical protein